MSDLDGLSEDERAYVLHGATGDDPLRDEDLVRLNYVRNNRMFFRQRNEYGPPVSYDLWPGRKIAIAVLAVLCLAVILFILIGGNLQ